MNFNEYSSIAVVTPRLRENSYREKYINTIIEQGHYEKHYIVTSKLGQLTANDFGKVVGLYTKDLFEEFIKDHKDIEISKAVNKQLSKLITNCIREVWITMSF